MMRRQTVQQEAQHLRGLPLPLFLDPLLPETGLTYNRCLCAVMREFMDALMAANMPLGGTNEERIER
jgi:hypothetical protein